jgi:hypothetical protein
MPPRKESIIELYRASNIIAQFAISPPSTQGITVKKQNGIKPK